MPECVVMVDIGDQRGQVVLLSDAKKICFSWLGGKMLSGTALIVAFTIKSVLGSATADMRKCSVEPFTAQQGDARV